jgi:cytochrome P450
MTARAAEPLPRERMLWITDYWEASDILRSPSFAANLHSRHSYPIAGESIVTLERDEHLQRRRTELPLFTRSALERYEFENVVPSVREALAGAHEGAGTLDLLRVMHTALLRVSAAVIGLDDVTSAGQAQQLRSIAQRVGEAASVEWTTQNADDIVRQALEAKQEFVEAFYGPARSRRDRLVAAWRAGALAEDDMPLDLITILLKAYSDWDDDKLLREVLFYLAASSSTTTNAAPHVFMEFWHWIGDHPEDKALLGDASFVQLGVAEALRLHPTVPALIRKALDDATLTSGRAITAGQQIAIDLYRVNFDPAVFGATASRFDPRRLPPLRVPRYAAAFAAGPHTCIGRRLAAGSATGVLESGEPVGVLARLMLELFCYDVTLDPARPPVLRTDTLAERYETFPVIVRAARSLSASSGRRVTGRRGFRGHRRPRGCRQALSPGRRGRRRRACRGTWRAVPRR